MLGSQVDIKIVKYGIICAASVFAFIFILFFKLIFGSILLGVILFLSLIWFLIFKIGIMIMYPGSSSYFTSDIEMRIGNQLSKNLSDLGYHFQFMAQCIRTQKILFNSPQWGLKDKIYNNLYSTIEMLSMFENSLSDRKSKILQILRKIQQQIQIKHHYQSNQQNTTNNKIKSIAEFLQNPKQIKEINSTENQFFTQRINNILQLNNQFKTILITFKAPNATLQFFKYRFFQEKLYEVRFGFQRWNYLFEYEVHLINNVGYTLQWYAIFELFQLVQLSRRIDKPIKSFHQPKTIINSQCSVIQMESLYSFLPYKIYTLRSIQDRYIIKQQFKGYQVILWNYRGYGQSTGSPTINKSQSDAMKIYNYFTEKGVNIELVHGYSIGGVAAIGLVSKLEKRDKHFKQNQSPSISSLRSLRSSNTIKLIIVDRSFSSIGDMAIQFGPTLHKLARIVFSFENKNLSKQFEELRTQKLLIWDRRDEVIPETASVKGGILMQCLPNKRQSTCKNCTNCLKTTDDLLLNQEVSVLINQSDDQQNSSGSQINLKLLKRFSISIKTFLQHTCEIQTYTQNQLNVNHEYDPTQLHERIDTNQMTETINTSQNYINKVLKAFQLIDGGGSYLPTPNSLFKKLSKENQIVFEIKCNSFILGLIYYGSLQPIEIGFERRNIIQVHTIKKIDSLIQELQRINNQYNGNKDNQYNGNKNILLKPELSTALNNLIKVMVESRKIIENNFMKNDNKKFGKLIACSNGHNGSLPYDQLNLLMQYVRQICVGNHQGFQQSVGYESLPMVYHNSQQFKQNDQKFKQIDKNQDISQIQMSTQMNVSRLEQ